MAAIKLKVLFFKIGSGQYDRFEIDTDMVFDTSRLGPIQEGTNDKGSEFYYEGRGYEVAETLDEIQQKWQASEAEVLKLAQPRPAP